MSNALSPAMKSLPPLMTSRPMLMLTGFLGAGKTTLLRSILGELSSRDLLADVILNDIANARIDRDAVQDHAASVEALTGSCVCCEGMDLLYGMILKASNSKHHVLMIELNGTADPVPLHETFTLMQSSFLLQPRWQVCVVDTRFFGQRTQFRELEKLQLETASHYYLAHTLEAKAQNLEQLEKEIQSINPRATRTSAAELAASLSQAVRQNRRHLTAISKLKPKPDFLSEYSPRTPAKPHLHDRHQLAHEFTGCTIVIPKPVESSRVDAWLEELPPSVIRTKALVTLNTDLDCRFLYERVGTELSLHPIPVRAIDSVPCSGIFIGPDLQPDEILRITRETLHPDCHFPEK
jgi:G3E family GTPase